jgi:polysaccharide deacetylase family protein (PEP-CTERM system associated)
MKAWKLKAWEPRRRGGRLVNAMSVDVEDWYHAQALGLGPSSWETAETRVEGNTGRILDAFAAAGIQATFFVLGWVAARHPALVRRIVAGGHELASHGWDHTRADRQTPEQFRADVRRAKATLEDIGGAAVKGYRAATFSISHRNPWAFAVLAAEGYSYSSSVYPVRHDYYGMPEAPRFPFHPLEGHGFEEYPLTSVALGGRNLPCGGGGWFRLLPYGVSRRALAHVNRADARPCIFYFHPWEIDPGQPRVAGLGWKPRLRHYTNLDTMAARIGRLLGDFAWDRMDRVLLDQREPS